MDKRIQHLPTRFFNSRQIINFSLILTTVSIANYQPPRDQPPPRQRPTTAFEEIDKIVNKEIHRETLLAVEMHIETILPEHISSSMIS